MCHSLTLSVDPTQVMEFSVNMLSSGSQKMRDIERSAKQQKLAIWTNYVPAPTSQGKLSDSYTGKVGQRRCGAAGPVGSATEGPVGCAKVEAR